MTGEFKALMALVGASARGKKATLPQGLDWLRVEALAREQAVQVLLGDALRLNPEWDCPPALRIKLQREMRQAAISNNAWRNAILRLLADMNAAGIPALLIKGYAVADCYAQPDCRVSGDTDILISPGDEKSACAFMKAHGFEVQPRWKNSHHTVCHHPKLGCVEMHIRLYDEIVEDVWFDRVDAQRFVQDAPIRVETEDGGYLTLSHTDHLLFLMLHLIKHFIISGASLGMIVDAAAFFSRHAAEVDSERLWRTLETLRFGTTAQCLLWTAVRYCGFDASALPGLTETCPEQVDAIVEDLETGGCMGRNEQKTREEGWYEYNRRRMLESKSSVQYLLYMVRWKSGLVWTALFPSRKQLTRRYPYLERFPLLMPLAWLHRLIFRGTRALTKGAATTYIVTDEKKLSTAGKARVQLFRRLGMLK